MKKALFEVLEDAAEFCKAANFEFVEVVKPGFEEFYFTVYNLANDKSPWKTNAMGICHRKNNTDFDFDIPLYKRGALDFLGIRADEDFAWKIADEDLFKIKCRLDRLNKKLSEY